MNELTSRQRQIIDISIKIISERGIQDLTMKNLSNELGISEPAIYRHFESKQKILIAVLESFKHQNKLINENPPHEGETAFQHLTRSIEMIMNKFNKNPAMSAVIFSEEIFRHDPRLSERVSRIMDTGDQWIRERSGIETRYYVEPGVGSSDLGARRRGRGNEEVVVLEETAIPAVTRPATPRGAVTSPIRPLPTVKPMVRSKSSGDEGKSPAKPGNGGAPRVDETPEVEKTGT